MEGPIEESVCNNSAFSRRSQLLDSKSCVIAPWLVVTQAQVILLQGYGVKRVSGVKTQVSLIDITQPYH